MKKLILSLILSSISIFNLFSVKDIYNQKVGILKELNLGIQQFLYLDDHNFEPKEKFVFTEIVSFRESEFLDYVIILDEKEVNEFRKICKKQNRDFYNPIKFYLHEINIADSIDVPIESKWVFYLNHTDVTYRSSKYIENNSVMINNDVALAIQATLNEIYNPCYEKSKENFFTNLKKLFEKKSKNDIIAGIHIGDLMIEDRGSFFHIYPKKESGMIGGGFHCYVEKKTYKIIKFNKSL